MFIFPTRSSRFCEARLLLFVGPNDDPVGKNGRARVALTSLISCFALRDFCFRERIVITSDIRESVCVVSATMLPEQLASFIYFFSESLFRAEVDSLVFAKAIKTSLNNAVALENQPATHIIGRARERLFADHPWFKRPHGLASEIPNVTIEDVYDFRNIMKRRARGLFVCSPGMNKNPDSTLKSELHNIELEIPSLPNLGTDRIDPSYVYISHPHTKQAHILVAAKSHSGSQTAGRSIELANEILGSTDCDSFLFSKLRTDLSLVYSTRSFLVRAPVGHMWGVHAEVGRTDVEAALSEINCILENAASLVNEIVFDNAKMRYMLKSIFLSDTPLKRLERLLDTCAINGSLIASYSHDCTEVNLYDVCSSFKAFNNRTTIIMRPK